MKTYVFPILICFLIVSNSSFSREFRVNQIPNGNKSRCSNCHVSSNGGGTLNAYGTEIYNNFLTSKNSSGNVIWNATLASKDSDKDGFTNGQELGDPLGVWKQGNSNPGNFSDVSNPGLSSSKPTDVIENASNQISDAIRILSLYPNPVINTATLNYELKYPGYVAISIYDYNGNEVKNIYEGFQSSGIQNFNFDVNSSQNKDISHGSYMIIIKSGSNAIVEKLIIK
jgi:hypothetical protein